ncbi:hypothetical protein BC828DRAFT_13803 [Blastocladiella britannica]|nr:hypothetical protein BC828DRAFT_13803 [Blastocladiella britannica]
MAMTVAMTVATAAEDKDRGRALASPSLCRFEAYISTNNPKIMRPISHDSPGLALIAYAFLAAAVAAPLATASIAPPRYTWSVVVDGQSTSASSALGVAGFTPILETNAAYTLTVSIITTADGTTCLPCARDLHAVGGYPVVVLANSQLVATQNWRNMTIATNQLWPHGN